ncbi:MAG: response regulator [Phycisphaerales bacterium JB038]
MALGSTQGDAGSTSNTPGDQRVHQRLSFEVSEITVTVMHPGGTLSRFSVACRDLSVGGIAFLHRGFLHEGTECQINLPMMTGGERSLSGKVVRCSHLKSNVHEVGIAFDSQIDPRQFMDVGVEHAELNDKPIEMPELQGRLLYIGSEALDFALLQHQLQGTSVQLTHQQSSQEAVAEARRSIFDVVLCETMLDAAEDGETIAELRTIGYRGPIIAITAERDQGGLRKAKQLGASEVLLKPYSPATLLGILAEQLHTDGLADSTEPIRSTLPSSSSLAPLVVDFIKAVKIAATALEKAAEEGDMEQLRRLCLRLRGNGSSYGFRILTESAGQVVEVLSAADSVEEAGHSLEQLLAVCRRIDISQAA